MAESEKPAPGREPGKPVQKQKPRPWVWDRHGDELYRRSWERFAEWVAWLESAYAPWVLLPPCWPAHTGLAAELKLFWYWHRWTQTGQASPADAVRWHSELRHAASAWRELATCSHEPPVRHRQAIARDRRRRTKDFVDRAMRREFEAEAGED